MSSFRGVVGPPPESPVVGVTGPQPGRGRPPGSPDPAAGLAEAVRVDGLRGPEALATSAVLEMTEAVKRLAADSDVRVVTPLEGVMATAEPDRDFPHLGRVFTVEFTDGLGVTYVARHHHATHASSCGQYVAVAVLLGLDADGTKVTAPVQNRHMLRQALAARAAFRPGRAAPSPQRRGVLERLLRR